MGSVRRMGAAAAAAAATTTRVADDVRSEPASELVLLGTGVSTGIPRISCVLRGRLDARNRTFYPCRVCQRALNDPASPNRRCNVSALVRLGDVSVLIDCGKTAREACMRQLPRIGVKTVEAVVLTHGHADAMLGLDDLRDIQTVDLDCLRDKREATIAMPVHLHADTMAVVRRAFPYLCPSKEGGDIPRRVSKILWQKFAYNVPFKPVQGSSLTFTPIRLLHGGTYVCAGFIIEGAFIQGSTVAYLSDVNEIPEDTMAYLKSFPRIDVLIIDSLLRNVTHESHFSVEDAKALARELRPRKTLCVGMTCSVGLHEEVDPLLAQMLETENLDIRLGYDGQRIPL